MTFPSLLLKSSHAFNSVLKRVSNASIDGGKLSVALDAAGAVGGAVTEVVGVAAVPLGEPFSKPTDEDAMSSNLDVAASSLSIVAVSTLRGTTIGPRRPGVCGPGLAMVAYQDQNTHC